MLFMVIEHFKNRDAKAVYRRAQEHGRMLPEGLLQIDSWVEANFERCFQLMECHDPRLFQQWTAEWQDLVEFEIIPVIASPVIASPVIASPVIASPVIASPVIASEEAAGVIHSQS